jgi:hypothetical protein
VMCADESIAIQKYLLPVLCPVVKTQGRRSPALLSPMVDGMNARLAPEAVACRAPRATSPTTSPTLCHANHAIPVLPSAIVGMHGKRAAANRRCPRRVERLAQWNSPQTRSTLTRLVGGFMGPLDGRAAPANVTPRNSGKHR